MGVTGVQTCALPIWRLVVHRVESLERRILLCLLGPGNLAPDHVASAQLIRSEERRGGEECRYGRDWSSDVCSSDLAACRSPCRVAGAPDTSLSPWAGEPGPGSCRLGAAH